MRFLLVAISLLFSFIFFLFYTANLGKNIYFISNNNYFFWESIFWSLWISPSIFLILTLFSFIYFKNNKTKYGPVHNEDEYWESFNNLNKNNHDLKQESIILSSVNKTIIQSNIFIYFIIFFFILIGIIFWYIEIQVFFLFIFYFSWILFYFISSELFYLNKISQNIFIKWNIYAIISWYFASVFGIIYNIFIQEEFIGIFILWITGFFHIYIHSKYENIISLIFWIITFIFALYRWIVIYFPWII